MHIIGSEGSFIESFYHNAMPMPSLFIIKSLTMQKAGKRYTLFLTIVYSASGLKSKPFVFLYSGAFWQITLESHVPKGPDLVLIIIQGLANTTLHTGIHDHTIPVA